jgi:hypothetical protein
MTALADVRAMQSESYAAEMRLLAHHDLAGAGDGMQLIKVGNYLYVAHVGSSPMALSILDVADPENPRLVRQLPHPPNTHNHKVQIVGNTLIQNSEFISYIEKTGDEEPVTGVNVYNLDDPTDPSQIAFYPVPDRGVHRIWFRDAPYAHIAAYVPGARTRAYQILDLSEPAAPKMVGCWWLPGAKPEDQDPWVSLDPHHNHFQVHGVIPHGDRAYASCTDAGMAILDVSDVASPKLLGHINWSPPYGGYSHTSLPLPGRGLVVEVCETVGGGGREGNGDKRIWLIDVREPRQPVMISSFPEPKPPKGAPWTSFHDRPLRFGPHNAHENYANGFVSETLIFSTWFNAGVRVTDISNQDRPEEVGYFIPPAPEGQAAPQINDLFVDENKLVYITDRITGGIYVLEYTGR